MTPMGTGSRNASVLWAWQHSIVDSARMVRVITPSGIGDIFPDHLLQFGNLLRRIIWLVAESNRTI